MSLVLKRIFMIGALIVSLLMLSGCEAWQKAARNKVSLMGGDFKVTFVEGSHVKSWMVKGGKVTSEPAKGYYFFWAQVGDKEKYVQVPIERTYIEEL